jgi:hypothetical protein
MKSIKLAKITEDEETLQNLPETKVTKETEL